MKNVVLRIDMIVSDETFEDRVKPFMKEIQTGAYHKEFLEDIKDDKAKVKISAQVNRIAQWEQSHYERCKEFAKAFSVDLTNEAPQRLLQLSCILEEIIELAHALGIWEIDVMRAFSKSLEKVYGKAEPFYEKKQVLDALIDTEYFANQIMIMTGISENVYDEGFKRVHKSNMDKLQPDGTVLRSDGTDGLPVGKVKKPNGWKPADLSDLV